jgi:hypothetical protein
MISTFSLGRGDQFLLDRLLSSEVLGGLGQQCTLLEGRLKLELGHRFLNNDNLSLEKWKDDLFNHSLAQVQNQDRLRQEP